MGEIFRSQMYPKLYHSGLLPLSPVNVNIMGYLHAGGKSRALIMRLRLLLRVRGRKTTFELQTVKLPQ